MSSRGLRCFGPPRPARRTRASLAIPMQHLHQLLPLESRDLRDGASAAGGGVWGTVFALGRARSWPLITAVLSGHADDPLQHIRQLAPVAGWPVIGHHGRPRLRSRRSWKGVGTPHRPWSRIRFGTRARPSSGRVAPWSSSERIRRRSRRSHKRSAEP
jgi:hypothetical protein